MILAFRAIQKYRQLLRHVSDSVEPYAAWKEQWEKILKFENVPKPVPLRVSKHVAPMLVRRWNGFELVVPYAYWDSLSPSSRDKILRVQLERLRQKNRWVSIGIRILAIPHWFNPISWILLRRIEENTCFLVDETVANGFEHPRESLEELENALLRFQAVAESQPIYRSAGFEQKNLEQRIQRIRVLRQSAEIPDSIPKRLSLITALCVLFFLLVFRIQPEEFAGERGAGIDGGIVAAAQPCSHFAAPQAAEPFLADNASSFPSDELAEYRPFHQKMLSRPEGTLPYDPASRQEPGGPIALASRKVDLPSDRSGIDVSRNVPSEIPVVVAPQSVVLTQQQPRTNPAAPAFPKNEPNLSTDSGNANQARNRVEFLSADPSVLETGTDAESKEDSPAQPPSNMREEFVSLLIRTDFRPLVILNDAGKPVENQAVLLLYEKLGNFLQEGNLVDVQEMIHNIPDRRTRFTLLIELSDQLAFSIFGPGRFAETDDATLARVYGQIRDVLQSALSVATQLKGTEVQDQAFAALGERCCYYIQEFVSAREIMQQVRNPVLRSNRLLELAEIQQSDDSFDAAETRRLAKHSLIEAIQAQEKAQGKFPESVADPMLAKKPNAAQHK